MTDSTQLFRSGQDVQLFQRFQNDGYVYVYVLSHVHVEVVSTERGVQVLERDHTT
jgi:hypothetical protein